MTTHPLVPSRPRAGDAGHAGHPPTPVTIEPAGDSALLLAVTTPHRDPEAAWRLVHDLARAINTGGAGGTVTAIATYDTVLVEFDPCETEHAHLTRWLRAAIRSRSTRVEGPRPAVLRIPVVYGGDSGPDLEPAAAQLGVTADALVAAHVGTGLVMRCHSHSGAAMLDGPPLPRPLQRLSRPRLEVAAGSVLLAGRQCVVLRHGQPSGWQVIGRTPVGLAADAADAGGAPPYEPGDVFSFHSIDGDAWADHRGMTWADCRG